MIGPLARDRLAKMAGDGLRYQSIEQYIGDVPNSTQIRVGADVDRGYSANSTTIDKAVADVYRQWQKSKQ